MTISRNTFYENGVHVFHSFSSTINKIVFAPKKMWWGEILFKKIQAALLTFKQTYGSTGRVPVASRQHRQQDNTDAGTQGGTMLPSAREVQKAQYQWTPGTFLATLSMPCDQPSLNRRQLLHLCMLEVVSITCPVAL